MAEVDWPEAAVGRALLGLGLLLILTGCSAGPEQAGANRARRSTDAQPVRVLATVGMITDIARRVGGERVSVSGLMGPGVDPHLYKANEADIRMLSEAEIVLYNGLNLEGKMGDIFVRLARKKPVVPVSEYVEPGLLREPPEMQGHHDPHIWFDVSLWMKAVERVRDAFSEYDAAGKDSYHRNAATLLAELSVLHAWCREQIAGIPQARRLLITAHDAFGYFGRAYGIEVRGIQGISTESEAGVREINELVELIVRRGVKAIFVESSVSRKNIEALVEGCRAKGRQVVIGGELFSDAMGAAGTPEGAYPGMVRHNVTAIVNALK